MPTLALTMTCVPERSGRFSGPPPISFLLVGMTAALAVVANPSLQGGALLPATFTPAPAIAITAANPSPTPTPPPALVSPSVFLSPLPPPPPVTSAAFLVLELEATDDRAAVSSAFDLLRRRDMRTLVFATPNVHPDFLRLAVADGHQVGLLLTLPSSHTTSAAEAQVSAWEVLLQRSIGPAGLPLALLPANLSPGEPLREMLAASGYYLVTASGPPYGTPGQVVRIQLGPQTADRLQALEEVLISHGLALLPHWLAGDPGRYPTGEEAGTLEEFRAAHIVVVDPGHTRMDVGAGIPAADGPRQYEYWANMQRARAIQEMLQADGWTVVLTHDEEALFDEYASAPDVNLSGITTRSDDAQFRANFAYHMGLRSGRRPVVISLHADSSSSPSVWGPIFFYQPDGDEVLQARSRRLALALQDRVAVAWQDLGVAAPSRGVHTGFPAGMKGRAGTGYDILGTIHVAPAPGADTQPARHYIAVLVEAGTASHAPEGHVLATVEGNHILAQAHREAINQWMMTELALTHLERDPRCPDPASLTTEQIAFLAAQEIVSGQTEEKRIAFTFDAGSSADPWPDIRAAFAEAGVQPTVFLTNSFIRQHPEVVRQMLADGYDLQSRTDTPPDLTELAAAVQSEFIRAQEALDEALEAHVPMCLWRPPYGARNAAVRQAAAELGMLEVHWSEGGDTAGWRENATAEQVIARVMANLRPGAIFLMHVDSWPDAQALPTLLSKAREQGYTLGGVWSVLTEEQLWPARAAEPAAMPPSAENH